METFEVLVKAIRHEALDVYSVELAPIAGGPLPSFTAGAHIDLHLPSALIRSYSLVNSQDERHRYVVGVARDAKSRGGSTYVHDKLRPGDKLTIGAPRNNFALAENAPHTVLISGGIGVTPLYCMIQRLQALGRSWELYLCSRTRHHAAFRDALDELLRSPASRGKVHYTFDQEPGIKMLDIAAVASAQAPDTHLYCCGPLPMLQAFEKACEGRAQECVHVEYFAAKEAPASTGGFTVVLAKSGKTLEVPAGKTILDAVLDAKIRVSYSCMEGICGSCEVSIIEGIADHRDLVLSKDEHAANKTMMICCSGSKSDRLVLDL